MWSVCLFSILTLLQNPQLQRESTPEYPAEFRLGRLPSTLSGNTEAEIALPEGIAFVGPVNTPPGLFGPPGVSPEQWQSRSKVEIVHQQPNDSKRGDDESHYFVIPMRESNAGKAIHQLKGNWRLTLFPSAKGPEQSIQIRTTTHQSFRQLFWTQAWTNPDLENSPVWVETQTAHGKVYFPIWLNSPNETEPIKSKVKIHQDE